MYVCFSPDIDHFPLVQGGLKIYTIYWHKVQCNIPDRDLPQRDVQRVLVFITLVSYDCCKS